MRLANLSILIFLLFSCSASNTDYRGRLSSEQDVSEDSGDVQTDQTLVSGALLYEQNCISCHDDKSRFEDLSVLQLKEAIYEDVSEMSSLEKLSDSELALIVEYTTGKNVDRDENEGENENEEGADNDSAMTLRLAGKAIIDANCQSCHPGARYPGKNEAQIRSAITTINAHANFNFSSEQFRQIAAFTQSP